MALIISNKINSGACTQLREIWGSLIADAILELFQNNLRIKFNENPGIIKSSTY